MALFTRKAFQYFDAAKKNNKKKEWLNKERRAIFEKEVRAPLMELLEEMNNRFGHKIPKIDITPRKVSRPLRSAQRAEKNGWIRASGNFFLAEKSDSFFEWNPGIFFQVGDEKQDNVIGIGLYGPSSRQLKSVREALEKDYKTLDKILKSPKIKKYWGGLSDQKYKRFPKDHSPDHPAAKYLVYKQFFLSRHFTRKEVCSKEFASEVLKSYEAALPFFAWIREAAGHYDRAAYLRAKKAKERGEDLDDMSHLAEDERAALSGK